MNEGKRLAAGKREMPCGSTDSVAGCGMAPVMSWKLIICLTTTGWMRGNGSLDHPCGGSL